MDTGTALVGGLIGLVVGLALGGAVGALLVMLGVRVVKKTGVPFLNAFLTVIAAGVAGFLLGIVFGFIWASLGMDPQSPVLAVAGLVIGFAITIVIYAAMLRPTDGSRVSLGQAALIYLVQLAVVLVIAVAVAGLFLVTGVDMSALGPPTGY